jgi:hypothetical protein
MQFDLDAASGPTIPESRRGGRMGCRSLALLAVLMAAGLALVPLVWPPSVTLPAHQLVARELRALVDADGGPVYFAGTTFDGQPLTLVNTTEPGNTLFIYGTCTMVWPAEGCSPPIQIANTAFQATHWANVIDCRLRSAVRGVPAAEVAGALAVFTGQAVVTISSHRPDQLGALAQALRDIRADSPPPELPPPPADVAKLIASHCASSDGARDPTPVARNAMPLARLPSDRTPARGRTTAFRPVTLRD